MSSKKKVHPKEKINHFFSKVKRPIEENSPTNLLAKRLRQEIEAVNTLETETPKKIEVEPDHLECLKKIKELETIIQNLTTKNRDLEAQNNVLQKDCKQLKKLFNESNKMNLQKDMKINSILIDKKTGPAAEQSMFKSFQNILTETELKELRSISISTSSDSKFITSCLRMLYKQDHSVLASRTAEFTTNDKKPITPSKKETIEKIFKERLLYAPSEEYSARLKKLNELLKWGIRNTTRKLAQATNKSSKE